MAEREKADYLKAARTLVLFAAGFLLNWFLLPKFVPRVSRDVLVLVSLALGLALALVASRQS
jgi:hypothetical protein